MITELRYFRVTCDDPNCESYINAAADNEHLANILETNKWLMRVEGDTYCPKHREYRDLWDSPINSTKPCGPKEGA